MWPEDSDASDFENTELYSETNEYGCEETGWGCTCGCSSISNKDTDTPKGKMRSKDGTLFNKDPDYWID